MESTPKNTPITKEEIDKLRERLGRSMCAEAWNVELDDYERPDDVVKVNGFEYPRWRTKTHLVDAFISVLNDDGFIVVSDGRKLEFDEIIGKSEELIKLMKEELGT